MSEWLTIGQVVDRLKKGETALSKDEMYKAYWNENNHFTIRDIEGDKFSLVPSDRAQQWRILPQYVTFKEAMIALKEGRKVKAYFKDGMYADFEPDSFVSELVETTLIEIYEAKWTIEQQTAKER